jgi:hypothetical protein
MDFLKLLMPGGTGGQGGGGAAGGNSGLLADWQAYSGDVEAGGGGTAAAGTSGTSSSTTAVPGQLAKAAEDVGSSLSSFFRGGYAAVSDGLGNIQTPSLENT